MSEARDIPKVHLWCGRRLEDLSREELIEAVIQLGEWNRAFMDGAAAERAMFGRIMKSARQQ